MSEVYNPESTLYEKLAALTLEARRLRVRLDETLDEHDRRAYQQQLTETERRVESLQTRLRHEIQ